jgi:hypothetical protein
MSPILYCLFKLSRGSTSSTKAVSEFTSSPSELLADNFTYRTLASLPAKSPLLGAIQRACNEAPIKPLFYEGESEEVHLQRFVRFLSLNGVKFPQNFLLINHMRQLTPNFESDLLKIECERDRSSHRPTVSDD